jgi:hypothetical protein
MVTPFFGKRVGPWRNSEWSSSAVGIFGELTLMNSFFTIAFASFVEAQHDFSQTFSDWLKVYLSLFSGMLRKLLTVTGL